MMKTGGMSPHKSNEKVYTERVLFSHIFFVIGNKDKFYKESLPAMITTAKSYHLFKK